MAFFVCDDSCYFSLSLDPAGSTRAFVFKLSGMQAQAARVILPACLATAGGAACLTLLIGIADFAHLSTGLGPEQQTLAICSFAVIAGLSALVEILWFLWVRHGRKSLLSEEQRRSLSAIRLIRRPSLETYWSFLLAMIVPVAGMIVIQKADPVPGEDVLSNSVIVVPLAIGTAALTFGLLKRIVGIGGIHETG
jgi:hypothetical protein